MSDKKLLREWFAITPFNSNLIKESREKNGGKLIIQGVIQRANQKNQNKRIYPKEVLMREIINYEKAIREGRSLGELDHPEEATVSLSKASHLVKEIWWER